MMNSSDSMKKMLVFMVSRLVKFQVILFFFASSSSIVISGASNVCLIGL